MDIKKKIGLKIRTLRTERMLSREALCQTEEELTIRQLGRIETGESLPTLTKLTFIAQQLGVPINILIDEEHTILPKGYLQLKSQVYRKSVHDNETKLNEKEDLIKAIYEEYYDLLPEEEQLAIDTISSAMDVYYSSNPMYGEEILKEYFFQILSKKKYTENDLLLVFLYLNSFEEYDLSIFDKIIDSMLEQVNLTNVIDSYLLNMNIITILDILSIHRKYEDYPLLLDASKLIMSKHNDFQKKPLVDMLEGKYFLFSLHDVKNAKQKYDDAAQLALLLNDQHLHSKIKEEWIIDYKSY